MASLSLLSAATAPHTAPGPLSVVQHPATISRAQIATDVGSLETHVPHGLFPSTTIAELADPEEKADELYERSAGSGRRGGQGEKARNTAP